MGRVRVPGFSAATHGARGLRRSKGSRHQSCSTLKKAFAEAVVDSSRADTTDARGAFAICRVATHVSFRRSGASRAVQALSVSERVASAARTVMNVAGNNRIAATAAMRRSAWHVALVDAPSTRKLAIRVPPLIVCFPVREGLIWINDSR